MKKRKKTGFTKLVLLILGALFITSCGSNNAQSGAVKTGTAVTEDSLTNQSDSGRETTNAESTGTDSNGEHHILVAYFSQAGEQYRVGTVEKGNTEIVAEMIAEKTGADLFHIERKDNYPDTYNGLLKEAQDEQKNAARPELSQTIENLDDYDTVFVGYPIWWGDMPMPVYTFLESYDFSGKTIIPFDTNEGSGLAGTVQSVQDECQGATVRDGLEITGKTAQKDPDKTGQAVDAWLKELGFMK